MIVCRPISRVGCGLPYCLAAWVRDPFLVRDNFAGADAAALAGVLCAEVRTAVQARPKLESTRPQCQKLLIFCGKRIQQSVLTT